MANTDSINIRSLGDKHWYWVDKAVIQHCVPKIGMVGLVVYSYLASMVGADQSCYPSQKHMAEALGCSRSTVCRALKRLEKCGLVHVEKRAGSYPQVYRLLRVSCCTGATAMYHPCNRYVAPVHTNNSVVTRLSNDTAAEVERIAGDGKRTPKTFRPETEEEVLGLDLAQALNDRRNLPLYLSYARKHPESLLRRALGEVKEVPRNKIKKSRAALFSHLIQTYEKQRFHNPGD